MTGGIIGSGVRVAYSTGSPHMWNKLEQVLDVTPPKATSKSIDITTHGPNDYLQNMQGLAALSDTVVTMLRDNDSTSSPHQNALFNLRAAKTLLWWRIEIPANPDHTVDSLEAYEFQGRVGSFEPAAPIDDKQTVKSNIVFGGTTFQRYDPAPSLIG